MNTVYIEGGKLQTRLLGHLDKKEFPVAKYYRVQVCVSEEECREKKQKLLDEYKRQYGKLPMYNERID